MLNYIYRYPADKFNYNNTIHKKTLKYIYHVVKKCVKVIEKSI